METEQALAETIKMSFDEFGLAPEVREAIQKLGFEEPTPVQVHTYRTIMAGKDAITMAQTGTGKTAAFGIPIAQMLAPGKGEVQALVLTPTRELALQVCRELDALGKIKGVHSAAVYGGASFTKQVVEVGDGAQVVVGTPGRVLDHIRRGTISFDSLLILVLDEADEMLSMGFEREISEIIDALPKKRQNLLFSATIPDDIRRLSKRYMGEAEIISVSGDAIAAKEISHFVYLVSGEGRPTDMVRVLEEERPGSAIIFCNTKEQTQTLARFLKKSGFNAEWLNSDLSQAERESVMGRTRQGKIKFLVATDVAARGIDVSHLSHVINYSFPMSLEVYVHRTGRTGRMGRQGAAVSLVTPQDIGNLYYLRLTYNIHPIEKTLDDDREMTRTVELDRLAQLRASFLGGTNGDFLSLARRLVRDAHGEKIIAGLLTDHFAGPKSEKKSEKKPSTPSTPSTPPDGTRLEARNTMPLDKEVVAEALATARSENESKQPQKKSKQPAPEQKPEPRKSAPPRSPEDRMAEPSATDREIYVDAGRRDGLRISFLMKEVGRLTDLPRSAMGKVRLLARSTFVTVTEEHFKTVLEAISEIELDGRKLVSEPAKPRS